MSEPREHSAAGTDGRSSADPEKDGARIRRMFADISGRYDLLNRVLSLGVDRGWRRRAVRSLALRPSARVLDVCTGTADLALELARSVRSEDGGHVWGADFCPEMVDLGERKRSARGEDRVTLLVADALALPFPDASFDAVTVAFGIRNVSDLRGGLAELVRVLKPGGRLAVLEFTPTRPRWMKAVFGFYFHRVLPRIGRWLSRHPAGGEAYAYLPASVEKFPSADSLRALLEELGLGDVRYRLLSFGIAALHMGSRQPTHDRSDAARPVTAGA